MLGGIPFGATNAIREYFGLNKNVNRTSTIYDVAEISGNLLTSSIIVGGVILRPLTAETQLITRWTTAGSIESGAWVMTGGQTVRNYVMAGAPEIGIPFRNAISTTVPSNSLRWPSGWEKVKGFLGQRIYQP